jgi:protoheme ferro-lyase
MKLEIILEGQWRKQEKIFNDYQEHCLQTAREITERYLESQKDVIKSFQSTWVPHVEMEQML